MRPVRGALRWGWIVVVLAFAGCATVPTEYREPPPLAAAERPAFNLRVFNRAWELIERHYFDPAFRGVDWRAVRGRYRAAAAGASDTRSLYAVLNRMCAELKESHLVAVAPRRVHEMETERRVAVGIRWQLAEGRRVVTEVVPGSPAAAAGVRPGWLVLSRNGAPIREGEVFVAHLGQPIRFEFRDERDQVRAVTVEPQLLNFERTEQRPLADGNVYLRFDEFGRASLRWLSEQLKAHADAPAVIVDLRQNGGGNTLALNLAVAEFFRSRVNEGTLVRRSGRVQGARSFGWLSADYRGRVVLLVGPYTASAAEIFSHVLQYHHRALVVGRRTAGAVIYARSYGLPGGGSLQVPVIDYIGLDGRRLEGRGVTPDLVTPAPTFAELRSARDPELDAAIAAAARAPSAADSVVP